MKLHEKLIYLIWIVAMTIQAWAFRQLMKKAEKKLGLSSEYLVTGYRRTKHDV